MNFFKKVVAFFKKAFSNTNWEQTVIATLNIVGPLLQSVIAFTAGIPAAEAVGAVINEVNRDLATLMGLSQTYALGDHATITSRIVTVADEIKANLAGLLADGHIKDAGLLTKVEAIVNTVVGEVDAIVKSIPAPAPLANAVGA